MSRPRATAFVLVFAACGVAFAARAADPAPPQDSSTQLKTYSVGGTKNTPKPDAPVIEIEKPKFDSGMKFDKQKVVVDMEPFVVTPVTASPTSPVPVAVAPSPAGKTAAAAVAAAPTKPAAAPAKPNASGTAATGSGALPAAVTAARPAPAPSGALPQAQATAPPPRTLALVPISTPAPDYPREAAIAGTQGFVVVEFTINSDGSTQDINVVDASPQRTFDQAARRAVSRWKFQPLLEDGRPVEKRVQRRIEFKL